MGKKDDYIFNAIAVRPYDFRDKRYALSSLIKYALSRTQSMFTWSGLPDTIPSRDLELLLQINGCAGVTEVNGSMYAFRGGLGGEPDPYYMPTVFTVANPALKYNASLKIGDDVIIIPNDSLYQGLLPMMERYQTMLVENELSLNIASINSRIISLISAGDDRTAESAREYIKKVIQGDLDIIASNQFFEGIKAAPYGNSQNRSILDLLEYEQYIKASFFNEIGLNANYNMKREALNSGESKLNDDMLLPLIDDMLRCRRIAVEKINRKYGLNIEVSLASSWEDNQEEINAAQEALEGSNGPANEGQEVKDDEIPSES